MQLRLIAASLFLFSMFAVAIDTWEIIPLVGPTGSILADVTWTPNVSFDLSFYVKISKQNPVANRIPGQASNETQQQPFFTIYEMTGVESDRPCTDGIRPLLSCGDPCTDQFSSIEPDPEDQAYPAIQWAMANLSNDEAIRKIKFSYVDVGAEAFEINGIPFSNNELFRRITYNNAADVCLRVFYRLDGDPSRSLEYVNYQDVRFTLTEPISPLDLRPTAGFTMEQIAVVPNIAVTRGDLQQMDVEIVAELCSLDDGTLPDTYRSGQEFVICASTNDIVYKVDGFETVYCERGDVSVTLVRDGTVSNSVLTSTGSQQETERIWMKSIVTSGFLGETTETTICKGEVRLSLRDDGGNSGSNRKLSPGLREEAGRGAFSVAIEIASAATTSGIWVVVVWTNLLLSAAIAFL